MSTNKNIVITSAVRTAIGSFRGSLKDMQAKDLGASVVKSAMKKSNLNPKDIDELINRGGSGAHHIGGTRMGLDKFDSVINKDLKVHDINNLYISGSSNFVTSGYTNPTYTIIQFALRLADEINEKLNT